jgi:hypothetical protein
MKRPHGHADGYSSGMKRTTVWLPEDLRARLEAESRRSGVPAAELIRRAVDAVTPPLGITMGELVKAVDREALLKVLVLDARDGKLLVEPMTDDAWFKNTVRIWVDGALVRIEESGSTLFQNRPPAAETWKSLRLNKDAPKSEDQK